MKKLILSLMLVAFAVAVQAGGDGCCAAQATKGTVAVSAKVGGDKAVCTAGAKEACSAEKQACTADAKKTCSAEAKTACSAEAKGKSDCAMAKSGCCGKAMKQVKLKSPKDS
jgi:hypothetical protein